MDVENVNERPTVSSSAVVDWAAAFQSPEFCSGLQTVVAGAIAKTIGARGSTELSVTALEQMGEVCPTATVSAPEAHATTEGVSSAGTTFLTNSSGYPSVLASPSELVELHQQTRALMFQGIASSTRRTYSSAQRKFLEFCHWSQSVHPNGSPLPASEWTLMLFASHLSNTIKASSIKVYLAAIRSLHLENGFPNPLANCLRLERVIPGIKRCQGTSKGAH